jgi:hypothetical protein
VVAFLLDLRHPVLRTSAQMTRETGLSPVVSIPVLEPRRRGLLTRLLRARTAVARAAPKT